MTILISLIVSVIGAAVYYVAPSAKLQELGRIAYFAGLLVFLFQIGERSVALFK